MSQELGYQSYIDQPRVTARLIVAGIGLLLVGLCGACIVVAIPFTLRAVSTAALMSNRGMRISMWLSAAMVLLFTIICIWTGVACFLGKRWIRPIILIASVVSLAIAVPTLIALTVAAVHPLGPSPAPVWASLFGVAFALLFYLGLPLAYLLMFRPQHVRDLLERLDVKPRWTDGIPVPLLGMSLVTLVMGIQLPVSIMAMPEPMLFGVPLPRLIAAVPLLVLMAVQLVSAVMLYRQRVVGWWLAVSVVMLLCASNLTNLLVHGNHLYDQMFGKEMSAQMAQSPMGSPVRQLTAQGLMILIMLGSAIWVKLTSLGRNGDGRGFAVVEEQAH